MKQLKMAQELDIRMRRIRECRIILRWRTLAVPTLPSISQFLVYTSALLLAISALTTTRAQEHEVDFLREIQPILSRKVLCLPRPG